MVGARREGEERDGLARRTGVPGQLILGIDATICPV